MFKSSISHQYPNRNTKPDISTLFLPIHRDFASYHREWHELRTEEASMHSQAGRYRLALQRTQIVESFPQHERPDVLDRLNEPLAGVYGLFGEGVHHEEN